MEIPRYIRKGVHINSDELDRLRVEHTENVLKGEKLILILDLDNTLLHSEDIGNLSPHEKCFMDLAKDDPTIGIFKWGNNCVTKLRPFVRTFLKEASEMYDMYIYTMGTGEYAAQMCRFLDPDGVYFESKVISREDCTRPGQKGLEIVLAEERVMVIVDDNCIVWENHRKSLVRIKRYKFFGLGHRFIGKDANAVLSKAKELDESELHGGLANTLQVLKDIHRKFFQQDFLVEGDVRRVLECPGDQVQGLSIDAWFAIT